MSRPAPTPHRHQPLVGISLLLASAVAIQGSSALATTTFDRVPPVAAAGVSFAVAALALIALQPPRLRSWSRLEWGDALGLGVSATVASSFLYLALDRIPLGSVVTIQFLGPLATAVLAARGRASVVGPAALALVGVAMVSSAAPTGEQLGIVFALASGVGWFAYIVIANRRVVHSRQAGASLAVAMAVAGLLLSPVSIAAAPELATGGALAALVVVGLVGRALPFRLELSALGRLAPSTAGVLFSVQPAIAALVGIVALGQPLAATQLAGILAVVVASWLILRQVPVGGA